MQLLCKYFYLCIKMASFCENKNIEYFSIFYDLYISNISESHLHIMCSVYYFCLPLLACPDIGESCCALLGGIGWHGCR